MAEPTWETQELPLMEAIADAERDGRRDELIGTLAQEIGMDEVTLERAGRALYEAGYIGGDDQTGFNAGFILAGPHLKERGRRAIGEWPPENAYASFVQLLETRISESKDDNEKSGLSKVLAAVESVGTNVMGSVAAAFATRMAGLG